MADGFNIRVDGLDRLRARLARIADPVRVAAAVYQGGERIMAAAKPLVPVDTGTLRASGFVELPKIAGGSISVELGFGGPAAPYALAVHENPRSGQTGGRSPQGAKYPHYAATGQWKYLETPFRALGPSVTAAIRRAAMGR